LRSGTSVGANYREASRGRSKAEFTSKIGDCLKEIEETEYWLELLVDSGGVAASKDGRSARRNPPTHRHIHHD
jgi:four helix bundle protein